MIGFITADIDRDLKKYRELYEVDPKCIQIFSHDMSMNPLHDHVNIKIPIYVHSTFNTVSTAFWSIKNFSIQYKFCVENHLKGLIIHAPKHENPLFDKVIEMYIKYIQNQKYDYHPVIYIEHVVGDYLIQPEEMDRKIKQFNKLSNIPFGACIDTCHLYSSGYKEIENYFDHLGEYPILVHLNDSDNPFNSGIDRHAKLGTNIWKNNLDSLKNIIKKDYDFIIELKDPFPSLEVIL